MDCDTADDLALAERAINGDEDALRTLYERHADPLFAFIFHSLDGARPEAEEVWQDTLSAAIRALPTYRGQSRFFSWLCSIARHKIADHCRRQNRIRQNLSLFSPEDLTRFMDAGPLPDEIVSQQAVRLRVVEILGQLPPDYRTALVARYVDGHSVEEVARLLDKNYKAAESILSRAREAFRAALAAQPEEEL
jgi:RNA polymerase sigma-70 factor (ECF subfamily)